MLSVAITEFAGPLPAGATGPDPADLLSCTGPYFAVDTSVCAEVATILGSMATAYQSGGYQSCEVTTPTTTETSSTTTGTGAPYRYSGVEEVKPKARAPCRGALGSCLEAVQPSLFFLSWPLGRSERSAATFDAHRL